MKKLLQDSFKILRNNLLFIQPLLLYLLMIMLASTYFVSGHVALYPKMLLAVSMILLTVAFFAGWMYINKKGIDDYVEEDSAEEISIKAIKNFKLFFSGVGEYFFRVLKGFLCFGVLYAACFFFFKKLGKTIFANPVLINELNKIAAVKTNEELTSLLTTFNSYLKKLQNTIVIANSDDNGVSALKFTNRCVTFGLSSSADFMAKNIVFSDTHSIFDVYHNGEFVYTVKLTIPGRHNIYNALSVIAALTTAGVDVNLLIPYFETFSGMGRRLQKICEINGVTVYDDYAHHPTEIKAALGALRTANPDKNIVAVFQPHRYTRLKAFWQEFKTAFPSASRVVVTDVYSASEDAIEGVNSAEFVKGFDGAENYSGTIGEVAKKLLPTLKSGDIVVGLGAGTITTLGKELLKANEEIVWTVK